MNIPRHAKAVLTAAAVISAFAFAAHAASGDAPAGPIKIAPEKAAESGIKTAVAGVAQIGEPLELAGELRLNADHVAHVTPRVPGVVTSVLKTLGDAVHAGEVMAVIASKELAVAKAAYLAAIERLQLAQSTYDREKGLWEKKISAEKDYQAAKQALAEAGIDLRSSEQQLRALGLSKAELKRLNGQSEDSFTRCEIASPIDGTVIEKQIVLGESLQAETAAYVVADLTTVWADFSITPKDIPAVRIGQGIAVAPTGGAEGVACQIGYVGPTVETDTRAALARVIVPNKDGRWKPGMFVSGLVECGSAEVPVAVPKSALQTIGGLPNVFVKTEEGFQASPVTLGRTGASLVEISTGLKAGQTYASEGTFVLKAELEKSKGGQ